MNVFLTVANAKEAKSALEIIQNVSVLLTPNGVVIIVHVSKILVGMKTIMSV